MKICTLAILFFLSANICTAQFLKNLGKKLKGDAEWRVRNKADHEINKAIDTLFEVPKKIKDKKKSQTNNSKNTNEVDQNNNNTSVQKKNQNPSGNIKASASDEDDMTPKDGFITLNLSSTKTYPGFGIRFTGESVKYKQYKNVEITVTGPSNKYKYVGTASLNSDGKYLFDWGAPQITGEFTATVTSSDKKAKKVKGFTVKKIKRTDMGDWYDENIKVTNKAYDNLKEQVDQVSSSIGSKDKDELDKKMSDLKEKVDELLKLFKDLNAAVNEIGRQIESGKNLSPILAGNLFQLNNKLEEQRKKMEQIEEYNNHKPADNTICEYLVMVNEACAAFSVYTNIECLAVKGIIQNIMLDKGVPSAVSTINQKANGLSQPNDFALKEPAKIFSTSLIDAESLTTKSGTLGFAGDIAQFATDVLVKRYCGVFTGTIKHDYHIEFRNSKGQNWWTYGVQMRGVLSLRYPKGKVNGGIIKMKGTLEGNATKFTFFEDIEKEDDFHKAGKDIGMQVIPIKTFTPLAVSFATSERDIMGFGALARGLATPAYFNFGVDAEYDVNANKIKIFLTNTEIDFTSYVANVFVFVMIGMDQLPYIRHMTFPIHTVKLTLGTLIKEHNEFDVKKDSKGNISFKGKYNKHIGNKATERETDLNFSIEAKK